MEINDLILKELLKRGYKLEGETRVWDIADSKLWYLTPKQAQSFLDLEKNEEYQKSIIQKEINLIKENLQNILSEFKKTSCNLIDLGCGDGKKASLFIDELSKHLKIRYYPIDISSYMVSKAADTIRRMNVGEVLEFRWNISDFENLNNITPLSRDAVYQHHFMILLGNTLGNFDRGDILYGINQSMEKEDILIIGNGLHGKNTQDIINTYNDNKVNNFLIECIRQIGFSENEVKFKVRFKDSRVEIIYELKKDKKINHLGRTVEFKKGDFIITAISFKYSKNDLTKILSKFFSKVKIYTDKEETYALALCKK
jgi:uncharacterized SAM-dependent methyltransferase